MADGSRLKCSTCGHVGLADGDDGFFYCNGCGSQADDVMDTGVADEDFVDKAAEGGGFGGIYLPSLRRSQTQSAIKAEPVSQVYTQSQFWSDLNREGTSDLTKKEEDFSFIDGVGPTGPADFGSETIGGKVLEYEDYYNEVRMRYVMGLQLMLQFQCETLVKEFKVNPLVCGLAASVWLRFVSGSGVFDDDWADEVVEDSEMQREGEAEYLKSKAKNRAEPHNLYGRRAVMIWFRSLRKRIPLSCTLAVSFLVCHIAREAILPTEIVKWSHEGKLPYFGAFVEIEKQIGKPSCACPIQASVMFRPSQTVPSKKLETLAAQIAESIDLHLPPVNFYAIACRYIKQLSLPLEETLQDACRIHEWSMPPELWLSTNEYRLPTRVCVMSIIIVAIRIIFNINGFGYWERSLSDRHRLSTSSSGLGTEDPSRGSEMDIDAEISSSFCPQTGHGLGVESVVNSSHFQKSELDAAALLHKLEARYKEIVDIYEYSVDLPAFLQYCKDVAFAGVEPSYEDHEEVKMIKQFWDFYENEKGCKAPEDLRTPEKSDSCKRISQEAHGSVGDSYIDNEERDDERHPRGPPVGDKSYSAEDSYQEAGFDAAHSPQSSQGLQNPESTYSDDAIRQMKLNMEENRFCYIPPRVKLKRFDYLHYVRKKDDGSMTYVAHADYYILLRTCARVAQIDVRLMHCAVLSFERRLAWMEQRIGHCLHLRPPNFSCEHCSDLQREDALDDSIAFSRLNL